MKQPLLTTVVYGLVSLLQKWGRIKVSVNDQVADICKGGRVVVIANHPTSVESFCIPPVLTSLVPEAAMHRPFTIVDKQSFGWVYPYCVRALQLIPVERAKERVITRSAAAQIIRVVEDGILVYYPEGGRTPKGTEFVEGQGVRVRCCNSDLLPFIQRKVKSGDKDLWVIPIWADCGDVTKPHPLWYSVLKLLVQPIHLKIGRPVLLATLTKGTKVERDQRIAQLLLSTAGG